jgi:hypothetical protein
VTLTESLLTGSSSFPTVLPQEKVHKLGNPQCLTRVVDHAERGLHEDVFSKPAH